jgi:hypothetical protein
VNDTGAVIRLAFPPLNTNFLKGEIHAQEVKPLDFDDIKDRIIAALKETDGETLAELHNMICPHLPIEYVGDSLFQAKSPPSSS